MGEVAHGIGDHLVALALAAYLILVFAGDAIVANGHGFDHVG